jgi:hypothetical protein
MMGLANMAVRLAYLRALDDPRNYTVDDVVPRDEANGWAASTEYYAIIDRISRGEKP